MQNLLFCDLETYSDIPINCGTHRYAENAEILLFAYAYNHAPVKVWDVTQDKTMPADLKAYLDDSEILTVWHNGGMFDTVILKRVLNIDLPLSRVHDTLVQALAHGLPGALGLLCDIFNVNSDKAKDKEGKALISLLCKPRPKNSKIQRATALTHTEEWQRFKDYAGSDILAMREIYQHLPNWNMNVDETELWQLDQKINRRGMCMDVELAKSALTAVENEQKRLSTVTQQLTDNAVQNATQRDALLQHIASAFGITLPDMQASTLQRRINDTDIPPALRELLSVRLQSCTTSTSKYKALLKSVSADGRLRGTKQFCGASRTGRWAGRVFQPDNLPRPTLDPNTIDNGIEALKAGCAELICDDIMQLTSSALRGCIIAPPGKKLVISDLSNIEGRMLAWLAGENWKVNAFSEFDNGKGDDLYKLAYARAFNLLPEDVTKEQRQIGKVMELGLGYGGGVAAFLTFALAYGLDLDELAEAALPNIPPGVKREAMRWYQKSVETDKTYGLSEKIFVTCDSLKRMWRNAHPQTVSFWYDIEDAVKQAIQSPGIAFKCRKLSVRRDKGWLRICLPSGRSLCYPSARIENGQITYMGTNPYSRKWERLKTYGGKLCLAKGTLVLTITGWMPIEIVSQDAYVWDGIEWVRTDGSVFNGNQEVIQAYGVGMTADHQVLTEKGWKSASQSKRYNRSSCRLPDGYELPRFRRKEINLESTLHLWTRNNHSSHRITKTKKTRYSCLLRMPKGTNNIMQKPKARNVKTPRFCCMEQHVSQMYSPFPQSMVKLWWSGNNGLQTLAKKFQQFLGRHGQDIPTRLIFRSHQQQCRLPPQKLPLGYVASTSSKYPTSTIRANSPRHNEYTGISSPNRDCSKHALLSPGKKGKSSTTSGAPKHIAEVYDLINCGPRNRFVIATPDGPLIVHNCENICQSTARDVLAYSMPPIEKAGYEIVLTVHDEIISEAPDTPQFSAEGLSKLLSFNSDWAWDLPLSANGFETYRYRKE